MSEGRFFFPRKLCESINSIFAVAGPAARVSSFLIFPFPLFALPSAGEVDKIELPEGMQSVNFYGCTSLTGTAEIE